MRLLFASDHADDLRLLADIPIDYVGQFCLTAVDFLLNGENIKLYNTAAQRLGVTPDRVQGAVRGLMFLLMECSKLKISEPDFHDSVAPLSHPTDVTKVLLETYMGHRDEIRRVLGLTDTELCHYKDLQWRLEVQVGGRTHRGHIQPLYLLQLTTQGPEGPQQHTLQTDIPTLGHVTVQLENALKELRTHHYKRVQRNIR